MRRKKAIDFLLVTLFFGILVTFTVIIGIGSLTTNVDGDAEASQFNTRFYTDGAINSFVKYVDYKVFGHIEDDYVLIGKDDWLFEAVDSQNGYERLLDYVGGNTFSDGELEKIAKVISDRAKDHKEEGIGYVMIVIPDSMTVCSEYVPWYLGEQSENTRLSQVTRYMSEKGIVEFVNPAYAMNNESDEHVMYNNTENSINAYGAYCIYNTAVSYILATTGQEVDRIHRDDVEFYTHRTDGRAIAQMAGLEHTIKNKTVSVADGMNDEYTVVNNERSLITTERINPEGRSGYDCVTVEYTYDWDRIQLMPYFSNTFDKVNYRDTLMTHSELAKYEGTKLVIQIIHEHELDSLLN